MNKHKFLLATAVITSLLFMSCGKDNGSNNATVNYEITTTNRTGGLVNWTSGTAIGKQIAFKGTSTSRIEQYALNFEKISLFNTSTSLGKVEVPAGTYTDAEFNYQMTPTREPALQLKGTYSGTPVILNISEFVEIATKMPTVTLEAGKTYTALLKLDLNQAFSRITAANLTNATRTNGEIIISTRSNVGLYDMIFADILNRTHTVEVK